MKTRDKRTTHLPYNVLKHDLSSLQLETLSNESVGPIERAEQVLD